MKKQIIKVPGGYVYGFNRNLGVVSVTAKAERARRFEGIAMARKFLYCYADNGYGLSAQDAQIERASCRERV